MQHQDPHSQESESNTAAGSAPYRTEEDSSSRPTGRIEASLRDVPANQSAGGTRRYYEF